MLLGPGGTAPASAYDHTADAADAAEHDAFDDDAGDIENNAFCRSQKTLTEMAFFGNKVDVNKHISPDQTESTLSTLSTLSQIPALTPSRP